MGNFAAKPATDSNDDLPFGYVRHWQIPFLGGTDADSAEWALILLNQPFPADLFKNIWQNTAWHAFADGAANRAYDILGETDRGRFLPNLIKGDMDSIRPEVKEWYEAQGVEIVTDGDLYSTDFMKCIASAEARERALRPRSSDPPKQIGIVVLGGLSGRLDQTVHTLSCLHKLRKRREKLFVVTDENVSWILDSGEHYITVDQKLVGPTCGLLPVGVAETVLTTKGLRWDLDNRPSSFDGMVSTSNHLADDNIYIKTTQPIWWCVERRSTN